MTEARAVTASIQHRRLPNQKNETAAAKRGTYIHTALAEMSASNFREIPDWVDRTSEAYISIRRAQRWLLDHDAETIMAERSVAYQAADGTTVLGRIDLLAWITTDAGREIALIDYKTEDRRSYEADAQRQMRAWSQQLTEYIRGIPDRYTPSSTIIIHMPRQSVMTVRTVSVTA